MPLFTQEFTAVLNFGNRTGVVGVGIVGDMIVGEADVLGGVLRRRTGKELAAAADFSGAVSRRASSLLEAALSFSGALRRSTRSSLDAMLSFAGGITKGRFKVLASTLVFGDQTYNSGIVGSGIVGYMIVGYRASRLEKLVMKSQTAALDFIGDLPRPQIAKGLSATLSFVGAKSVFVVKGLASTLSFVGVLTRAAAYLRSLTASLFFGDRSGVVGIGIIGQMIVGNGARLIKQTNKILAADVSFSGAFLFGRAFSATLSFVGQTSRSIFKRVTSALSFIGNLTWQTGQSVLSYFFNLF